MRGVFSGNSSIHQDGSPLRPDSSKMDFDSTLPEDVLFCIMPFVVCDDIGDIWRDMMMAGPSVEGRDLALCLADAAHYPDCLPPVAQRARRGSIV